MQTVKRQHLRIFAFATVVIVLAIAGVLLVQQCNNDGFRDKELLKKARGGDAIAMVEVGWCYYYACKGASFDVNQALKWFRKSNEAGSPYGKYALALCYQKGKGVEKDTLLANKMFSEVFSIFATMAKQNDAKAQCYLAYCYASGQGTDIMPEKAYEWYRKAAEQGLDEAQYYLACCYYYGLGVRQSDTIAAIWYRKAAEQGYEAAQNDLGICYNTGEGVEPSDEEAIKWYTKAAEQGFAIGKHNLGDCYYYGAGVDQSYEKAMELFRQSAEQGYVEAQNDLGMCYELGFGVKQSNEEAEKWYSKAAAQNHQIAKNNLKKLRLHTTPYRSPARQHHL